MMVLEEVTYEPSSKLWLWHHPYGCMTAVWVLGNPACIYNGCSIWQSHDHDLQPFQPASNKPSQWEKPESLNDCNKMVLKQGWCWWPMLQLCLIYDWNYSPNCGHKSRTICMYNLIFELRYMQSRDSTGPSNWNWEKGKNSLIYVYTYICLSYMSTLWYMSTHGLKIF